MTTAHSLSTATSAPNRAPALAMRGISKTFPGVKALDNVQLQAWTGEIHSLMGENGAGKSTLMKILSGAYTADPGGEIHIDGQLAHINGPKAARAAGIAIIYQELSLAPNLTVAENIYLGHEPTRFGVMADRATMRRETAKVLERLGAEFGPDTVVNTLSIAE
ncbi:MAG TPA: ATP-binding cassette domain-containing protein, partial [Candidatus Competibacteraceae bacterium]|nr:ATP-binding cassette domain-containing protein [Candidatus Competibacteraceae bacterium]